MLLVDNIRFHLHEYLLWPDHISRFLLPYENIWRPYKAFYDRLAKLDGELSMTKW